MCHARAKAQLGIGHADDLTVPGAAGHEMLFNVRCRRHFIPPINQLQTPFCGLPNLNKLGKARNLLVLNHLFNN